MLNVPHLMSHFNFLILEEHDFVLNYKLGENRQICNQTGGKTAKLIRIQVVLGLILNSAANCMRPFEQIYSYP